jgi:hypothetical protein
MTTFSCVPHGWRHAQSPCPTCQQLNLQNIIGKPSSIPNFVVATNEKQPTGIKHDQDKPDMSLLSSVALVKIAQVMSFGKKKYSAHNWRGGFAWSRPLAAAARHLYAYIGGEDKDPETGLSHLAHACCCIFFVLEFEETKKELDDRFKPEAKT